MSKQHICYECNCNTYKLVPHPQDSKGEVMICEDCEYAITARLTSLDDEPIKNYADRRGI